MSPSSTAPSTATHQPADRRGRRLHDLRISVIDACNFRCTYCMPIDQFPASYKFLDAKSRLSYADILRVARTFAELGVRRLRITGGEPLLRKGVAGLIGKLKTIDGIDEVALTTNGALLGSHAEKLKEAGLDRITVSLDSLDPAVFLQMNGGRLSVERVLDGIAAAEKAGFDAMKINAVVQKGVNDHQMVDMAEHFRGTGHVLRFIEFMDVGNCNHWNNDKVLPSALLKERIAERWALRPVAPRFRGEVASRYAFEDGAGEIGFISSVSQPFCGDCHRARVSADGKLYTCLFTNHGTDLNPSLQAGDEQLRSLVHSVWSARTDRYSEQRASGTPREIPLKKVEMFRMGG
ncbi:MAG: GTP 3',8-cyclase MoaA [Pseudomonadota bacterium]